MKNSKRDYKGSNKRQKFEYKCNKCKQWYKRSDVEIDHIIEVGSLKSLEDIAGFIKRLTPEDVKAYQILCKKCHIIKTNKNRT